MKTYLVPPSGTSRDYAHVKRQMRNAAVESSNTDELIEKMGKALQDVIPFDHFIYMEPGIYSTRLYKLWPSYKGINILNYPITREQDIIILNSYHDTLVRICGKDDYGTITISVLRKYMREASTNDFSLLFLRKVVAERFIGLIGFISFKKDAYGDKEVSVLFELLDALLYVWKKNGSHAQDISIPPHDSDFFSLINLPGMQNVLKLLYKVSREDIPVLLLGETGTGKEGVANMIYKGSGRSQRPFIKINCGGIPLSLVESKLFGYQKGAFTGALRDTPGCFELADTGVLLLDELGELPLSAQAHLLRVLQEKVIERVGSSLEIPVNVRVIAATNRNLAEMVEKKEFRADLLYRLSIFPIYIPALRERREDIPVLLNFFILQQSRKQGFGMPPKLSPSEMRRLCEYPWPGNIREMQNAVVRAMLIWDGSKEHEFTIDVGRNLFAGMFSSASSKTLPRDVETTSVDSLRMEDMEKAHIRRVLDMTEGRITGKGGAAELLDMNPSTLRARMRKLGVTRTPSP